MEKIAFIGAGKVGTALGKYFSVNNIPISGYFSRSPLSARESAEFTESKAFESAEELVRESNIVFITVPDGQIKSVYDSIKGFIRKDMQICHCSGSMSAKEAFSGIEKYGASGFSIHPLFPVNDKFRSHNDLGKAFFCIEGNENHISEWKMLLENLGNPVRIISGENKSEYHAACAVSSNLVCALIAESTELLIKCGFTEKESLSALRPLIESNIQNILGSNSVNALTGAVERCDIQTVKKHIACFDKKTDLDMYKSVSAKLIELASEKHPDTDYSELKDILK